jgi:hypothetical protein
VVAALVVVAIGAAAEAQERVQGDPIPGAMIKVGRKPPGGGTIVAEGTTDAQGVVRFADLPPGQYFVRVALAGQSWEIAGDGAEKPMLLEGAATASSAEAGTRAAKPPVKEPKRFSRAVGENTMTVEYGVDWIRVGLAKGTPIVTSRSNIK